MGFFNEISTLFNTDELEHDFNIECFGDKAVVVIGYEKINTLSESEIVLIVNNKKQIKITGAKLCIKKLEEGEIVISGVIMALELHG